MNVRELFFDTVYDRVRNGEDIVLVTPDLAAPSLDRFRADFPKRYISVGVAEQNLISVASGLAAAGQKTVAWGLNPFVVSRAYDQLRNTVTLMNLPLIVAGLHSGLSSAISGATHVVVTDMTLMRTLESIKTYNASDLSLASKLYDEALMFRHPVYFRFDKDVEYYINRAGVDLDAGFSLVRNGERVAIVSCGRHVEMLSKIIDEMDESRPALIDLFRLPFDKECLASEFSKYDKILTVEEHVLQGGLGSAVAECIVDCGVARPVKRVGIDIEKGYPEVFGKRGLLQSYFGLDKTSLAKTVRAFCAI